MTIFIPIFQGVEVKNILRTDIYKNLIKQPNVRIVLFIGTKDKADHYGREFFHERVNYEVVLNQPQTLWDKLMGFLKFKLVKTQTIDLRRKMALEDSGGYLAYASSWILNRLLARRWLRKFARGIDYKMIGHSPFGNFFDQYQPDVVFLAHLFDDLEIKMLWEAKRRGIRTVGFINSWDKLTARGMIRLLPETLLVFNDLVKQEAVDYADMNLENIEVVGIPQYDRYSAPQLSSRDDFYNRIKIEAQKRVIVYAPMGKYFSNSDWDIIDLLRSYQNKKLIPHDVEILVRFQPNDFIDEAELKKRPWLVYDYPGIRFSDKRGVDWDMSFTDLQHLVDTLYYSSIFICYATSLSIDAAVFDRPVININFEVKEKQRLSQTPTHFYRTEHYSKAGRTGGIRFVNSEPEFLEWINQYLAQPNLDHQGRKRLINEQCWKLDGQSAYRVTKHIFSCID